MKKLTFAICILYFIFLMFLIVTIEDDGYNQNNSMTCVTNDSRLEIIEFNQEKLQGIKGKHYIFSTIILKDKVTNVMYIYCKDGTIVPMIDAEGQPLLYKGE